MFFKVFKVFEVEDSICKRFYWNIYNEHARCNQHYWMIKRLHVTINKGLEHEVTMTYSDETEILLLLQWCSAALKMDSVPMKITV